MASRHTTAQCHACMLMVSGVPAEMVQTAVILARAREREFDRLCRMGLRMAT